MKKIIKALTLTLVLSLTLVCAGLFATACNKDKDEGEKYSVYVVYPDGSAVNGHTDGTGYNAGTDTETVVYVQWCNYDTGKCYEAILVGTDGKASVSAEKLEAELGKAKYKVTVIGEPEGYTAAIQYMEAPGELKITLTAAN